MQPREAGIGVRAERDQTARDGDETGLARGGRAAHRRVTDVVQRFPAARPAGRGGERWLCGQPNVDSSGITEQKRRVEVCTGDSGMLGEQPLGSLMASASRGFNELVDGGVEFKGEFLDALAKRVPRVESLLTGRHRLVVVECVFG